jgi:hypothetical protein
VVETIAGTGFGKDLVGLARHTLSKDRRYRDVQADIVLEGTAEVIEGPDARYDDHLWSRFPKDLGRRIFVALVVPFDEEGRVLGPETVVWRSHPVSPDENVSVRERLKAHASSPGILLEVIGTIEIAFPRESGDGRLFATDGDLAKIVRHVTDEAGRLYQHTLDAFLEQLARETTELAKTPSATLQLLRRPKGQEFFAHFVAAGRARSFTPGPADGGVNSPPRSGVGAGVEAIRREGPVVITPSMIEGFNPKLHAQGVTSVAAFPLLVDRGRDSGSRHVREGLLYLHLFDDPLAQGIDREIAELVWTLIKVETKPIALLLEDLATRDRERRVRCVERLEAMLRQAPGDREGLCATARNILAADVVALRSADGSADGSWTTAGRFADVGKFEKDAAVEKALASRKPVFAEDTAAERFSGAWVKREGIEAAAVVPLRTGSPSALLLGYRVAHPFSELDRELIERFGRVAAAVVDKVEHREVLGELRAQVRARGPSFQQ